MLDNLPLSPAADKRNSVQFNERTTNRDLEKEKKIIRDYEPKHTEEAAEIALGI